MEDQFGIFKFLIFYLIAGLAATFQHVIFNTGSTIPNIRTYWAIPWCSSLYSAFLQKGKMILISNIAIQVPALIVISAYGSCFQSLAVSFPSPELPIRVVSLTWPTFAVFLQGSF